MSEPDASAPAEVEAPQPPVPARATPWRLLAIGFAAALVLIAALVAAAPWWAPLLPWGSRTNATESLAERIDALAAQQQQARAEAQRRATETGTSLQRLERRVGVLENRPAPAPGDSAELRDRIAKLAAAAVDLAKRVDALDQGAHAQGATVADLAGRVTALDKAVRGQVARGSTDTALALTLLRMHGAIAAGRPFAAEYAALAALAHGRPDIAAAATPLAEPAKTGVASRAVLAKELRHLAMTVAKPAAAPEAAAAGAGWRETVLARLRGLVTIRRIDAEPAGSAAAAVHAAELALAAGDLAGAVAALDKLNGASAEAATPWLRMARARLAVDTALHRIEALLTAQLGGAGGKAAG